MVTITGKLLLIAGIGVVLLLVGLLKKIKFIIKLGIVIAAIGFIATGGLTMMFPMLR